MRWLPAALLMLLPACQKEAPPPPDQSVPAMAADSGPASGSTEWKIQNAMRGGPSAIAGNATIMDWGATPDAPPVQIRAGTNGWTCFPDMAETPGNDPTCLDQTWVGFMDAWAKKKSPTVTTAGVAYMLQGGAVASNTDPFKMAPDSGQQWIKDGPHIMLAIPNTNVLASLPTDPASGEPYVMWKGTPYAHVMVPVQ